MKHALYILSVVLIVGYAGVCLAMYLLQRSLLYFPQPRTVTAAESTMRLPVDGAEIVVTVRLHEGPKAIVYFGGNGEDVSRSLASFAEAFPDHAIYLMHYRGYGGSTGAPTETANVADARALFEVVRESHPDIALVGRSLGSGVAVQVASRAVASRLVLITPYDSMVEIAAQTYPGLPVRWLMIDTYESGTFAPGITTPTTIIEAENDEVIPRASTEKLLRRFSPGIATRTRIDGVGHNDIVASEAYVEALRAALE